MSSTVPVTPTALQPSFDFAHIWQHPGSSMAGVAVIAAGAAQAFAGGTPTTSAGWLMFVMQLAGGFMAGLGK